MRSITHSWPWIYASIGGTLLMAMPLTAEPPFNYSVWDVLLRRYVNAQGLVNYATLKQDRAALDGYVASLAVAQPAQVSEKEQLAFWINAYNACVVKGVLDHYPVPSVKQVPGFFDHLRYRVAGQELTLNEIEDKGRALGDWRIHFAVVCASSSCPSLRNEAYDAQRLDEQLSDQARRFLGNPTRGLRLEGSVLWVSKIFDWYAGDFLPRQPMQFFRHIDPQRLATVLAPYLDAGLVEHVRRQRPSLKFMDYDWSLNAQ